MKRALRDGGVPERTASGFAFSVECGKLGRPPAELKIVSPLAGDHIVFIDSESTLLASHIVERVKKNGIPVLGRNLMEPPIFPFCAVPFKVSVVEEANGAKLAFIDPPQGPASDWEIKQA